MHLELFIEQVVLNSGAEPKIISTMASKSSIQSPHHASLTGNPDAENIYRDLLSQHKMRKMEDPVKKIIYSYNELSLMKAIK